MLYSSEKAKGFRLVIIYMYIYVYLYNLYVYMYMCSVLASVLANVCND